ncbi:amidohydrolase family protein [Litoribacter alkaliphilus]|uniref:Amidohydrolase family protein n=1 Tax=Litoribacter ruber TaxID=702568 RepID=A0AAP2CH79_9BACT|nr:amidohydrolase family protein [Litoribacter alkaliphilus]MBS9524628.1 amidohydrolase family protein [Litoribacter alkaliphilus]
MSNIYKLRLILGLLVLVGFLQVSPVKAQSDASGEKRVTGTFAITNATVFTSPGQSQQNTTIIIKNGLIDAIGPNVSIPSNAHRIAGDSLYVYPGFIDGGSSAGVSRPKDVEKPSNFNASSPPDEVAGITPYRNVLDYFDANSNQINDWRKAGFTMGQLIPEGGMLPGKTAIVVYGHKSSSNIYKENAALVATFKGSRGMYPATILGVMAKFRDLYKNSEYTSQHANLFASNPGIRRPEKNKTLEAFYGSHDGSTPIVFAVEDDLTTRRAIRLQEELGFKLILNGVSGAYPIIPQIKNSQAAVLLTLDLPEDKSSKMEDSESDEERKARIERVKEAYQARLAEAAKFHEAGIPFGFTSQGAKVGDVRKNIRLMIENGLSEEAALAALTINAAKILGIDNYAGTLEKGKLANMVIATDSIFKEDSQIKHVFADGHMFDYETTEKKKSNGNGEPADLEGRWEYSAQSPQGDSQGLLVFRKDGEDYRGEITLDNPAGSGQITSELKNISVDGSSLRFEFNIDAGGNNITFNVSGDISGNEFDGNLVVADFGSFPMRATKQPETK